MYPASLEVSNEAKLVATGLSDGSFNVYDFDGNLVFEDTFPDSTSVYLDFSPDGEYLAVADYGYGYDYRDIRVYDTETWNFNTLSADYYYNSMITFTDNGEYLITTDGEGYIYLWDYMSGRIINSYYTGQYYSMIESIDGSGKIVFTKDDGYGTLGFINLETGEITEIGDY